jgi:hypothetical protein
MKMGVSILPWVVVREPKRAALAPSFLITLKSIKILFKVQCSKFKVENLEP